MGADYFYFRRITFAFTVCFPKILPGWMNENVLTIKIAVSRFSKKYRCSHSVCLEIHLSQFNNGKSEGQRSNEEKKGASTNEEKKGASTRVKETERGKEKGEERGGERGREGERLRDRGRKRT